MLRYATVKVRENPQNFRVFNKGETPLETGYCDQNEWKHPIMFCLSLLGQGSKSSTLLRHMCVSLERR